MVVLLQYTCESLRWDDSLLPYSQDPHGCLGRSTECTFVFFFFLFFNLSLFLFGCVTRRNKRVITVSNFYHPGFEETFRYKDRKIECIIAEHSGLVNLKQRILQN